MLIFIRGEIEIPNNFVKICGAEPSPKHRQKSNRRQSVMVMEAIKKNKIAAGAGRTTVVELKVKSSQTQLFLTYL